MNDATGRAATNTGDPDRWPRVRLVAPSGSGYLHVAVATGPWRVPLALPSRRRRTALAQLHGIARDLRQDPRVHRVDVFTALLRPPGGGRRLAGQATAQVHFDAVLLAQTTTPEAANELLGLDVLQAALHQIDRVSRRTLAFAASNIRRIGDVDHDRPGVFLFNYFVADDRDRNLFAWQYTAGWFQDTTGLDNSTVLSPTAPDSVPYAIVNHCRWDRLRDVLPSLVFDRTFRTFVLRVFEENGVAPQPLLYRRHRDPTPEAEPATPRPSRT